MLEKAKERKQRLEEAIAKFEETHESIHKVRVHVTKHRGKYGVATGVGVTAIAMKCFGGVLPDMSVSPNARNLMVGGYKSSQTIVQETFVIQAKGNPGDVVMRVSDGMRWASKNEMARDLGVARSVVTQYFQGKVPDINGDTFLDLGKAGHVLVVPTNPAA